MLTSCNRGLLESTLFCYLFYLRIIIFLAEGVFWSIFWVNVTIDGLYFDELIMLSDLNAKSFIFEVVTNGDAVLSRGRLMKLFF